MSIWTHVAVVIRYDDISMNYRLPNFKYGLPKGSEGPLEFKIWRNPAKDTLTVALFGDLRNYEDPLPIVEYIRSKTKGFFIRQLSGIIETERGKTISLKWDQEKQDLIVESKK